MKTTKLFVALAVTLGAIPALADQKADAKAAITDIQKTFGFVPDFLRQLPEAALPGAWEQMKGLELSTDSAIPPKYKELIGLAVAAQIPCKYCIAAHTEFAKSNGASREEIGVALAEAGLSAHWAAVAGGGQLDKEQFRTDLNAMLEHRKSQLKAPAPEAAATAEPAAPPRVEVVDAQTALDDAKQQLGVVPEFLTTYPANAVAGAWKTIRDVELNPDGPVPSKYIHLIGLAVGSQSNCEQCVMLDTEFAKAYGATTEEINEAIALGGHTRQMSTLLNGMQLNEQKFKSDISRITRAKPVAQR